MTDQATKTALEVETREVPERLLIVEDRVVNQPQLAEWLKDAMDRVYRQGAALGNPEGPGMMICHGEVTLDKSAQVEAAMVIDRATPPERVPANTRIDPAHREAYARITKAQLEFPAVLDAYTAVWQWLMDHGREVVDAPREVYFADVEAAADDDLICDIAFPYR